MKRINFLSIFLLFSLLLAAYSRHQNGPMGPDAGAGVVPDLAGTYVVNGFDPLGTE